MRTVSGSRNRTVLFLLGLLLLLGGVLLGLLSTGAAARVPGVSSWAPEPSAALGSLLGPVEQYLLPAGIALTVVAGLLALWWLAHQIPSGERPVPYRLADDPGRGTVTVHPFVLARAVEDQLEAIPGIARAHAELAGTAGHPQLLLRATLAPRTDVDRALGRIYGTVVADLETALEARLAHVGLELDVARDAAGSAKTSVRGAEAPRQRTLA